MIQRVPLISLVAAGTSGFATSSLAQIHAGDVAVGLSEGQIMVGNGDRDENSELLFDECIFGVELDSLARSTNPGFDTDNGVMSAGERIGYAYPSALRRWNGANFDTIPAERVRMSLGPVFGVSTPLTDPVEEVLGATATVSSNGEFHHHYTFRLEEDGSAANSAENLGIYLLELRLYNQSGLYQTSPSFWLVIENGQNADFEDAFEFARNEISSCGETTCLADVNQNGVAEPTDFGAWLAAYNSNDPAADQNQNGMVEPTDFGAWLGNYNLGCG